MTVPPAENPDPAHRPGGDEQPPSAPPPPPPPAYGPPADAGATPPAYGSYGTPGADPNAGYEQAPGSSTKALVSLVLGIVGLLLSLFCLLGILASVPAIVLGFLARRDIAASGGRVRGSGQATAGIVLGAIGVVLLVIGVALTAANT